MRKSTWLLGAALCAAGGPLAAFSPQGKAGQLLQMKEEQMFVEYTASANEAVIKIKAESESSLDLVEMRAPDGRLVLSVEAPQGRALTVSGFTFDLLESDPLTVLAAYAEGTYELRGRTALGRSVTGAATLSHALPAAPRITYPRSGDAHVPLAGLTIRWEPDANVASYRVMLEQNDNDGLSVVLPPGSNSFRVPDGVLQPGVRTLVEVGAVADNGNCTLNEIPFRVE